ncbi:putative choline transporter, neither null mutation nor overexpression affects choline transport [Mortierella sp. GBA43]|nr:putative choline transporter, neither null mutation nor overexpression affects choline transport [Mortierella sp. GBA43]
MDHPNYGAGGSTQPPPYSNDAGDARENAPLIPKADDGKFSPNPSYNDVWATILFLLNTGGFVALNCYSFKAYANMGNPFTVLDDGTRVATSSIAVDHSLAVLILSSIAVAFSLAFGYFVLIQRKTVFMVKFSFFFSVLATFALGIMQIINGSILWGALFLLSGVLILSLYRYWRARMPFAVLLLQTVTSVTRKYPGTIAVAFSGLFVQIAWSAVWIFSLVINYSVFQRASNCRIEYPENGGKAKLQCDNNQLYMAMVYLNFVLYWNTEVIKNIVHVTRAVTTSFGSICFGSLLIAFIQTLRFILNSLKSDSDEGLMVFLATCAECILACIEGLVEMFNKFAFTQVAIYGKPFLLAAHDTWVLLKDRGVDALINNNLVGNVLGMGTFTVGLISAIYGFVFLKVVQPTFYAKEDETLVLIAVVLVEFILGAVMMSIPNNVIDSGVTTTFVALAEDPQTLFRTKPDLYHEVAIAYPQTVLNVRGARVNNN